MGLDLLCKGRGGVGEGAARGKSASSSAATPTFQQSFFPPSVERHKQLSLGEEGFGG